MNYYQPFNPYFGQPMQPQMQRMPQMDQQYQNYNQQIPTPQPVYKQPIGLQGKSVDSIDVVKAMDIPLDGSISYFPLADGSAIVSKQLQMDGTSKTIIYEPVKADDKPEEASPSPNDILTNQIKTINKDNNELKGTVNSIKKQMDLLNESFTEFLEEMRNSKGGKK